MSPTHYMAIVYYDEVSVPVSIETFSFKNAGSGSTLALYDLEVYMGYSVKTSLNDYFSTNYLPGTRELVLQRDTINLTAEEGQWCEFQFDTPFEYIPDENMNLILEFSFSNGSTSMHNYIWNTSPEDRSVIAYSVEAPIGIPSESMIHLLLTGSSLSLDQESFGRVKFLLGN